MSSRRQQSKAAPKVSPWLLGWFRWYLRGYLPKGLHSLCVATEQPFEAPADTPLIVYLNHASWWDPVVSIHLSAVESPDRTVYAPFDEEALARYPIFEKLGFFGVDQTSRRGAAQFLKTSRTVLATPGASLWITPEGRFVDPRNRSADFEPGLAHLAEHLASTDDATLSRAILWPLAIEYPLWEERLPEALCRWGEPIRVAEHATLCKDGWNRLLVDRLRKSQERLAELSLARDPSAFRVLLGGGVGVGGLYDTVRRVFARLRGQRYRAAHSDKLSEGGQSAESGQRAVGSGQ